VTKAVVDRFETVQVQVGHGGQGVVALGLGQGHLHAVGEQAAVGQLGQGIVVGQVLQVALALLDVGDVGEQAHVVGGLTRLVAHRRDVAELGIEFAVLLAVPGFALPGACFM
jgi:hypothetical protein